MWKQPWSSFRWVVIVGGLLAQPLRITTGVLGKDPRFHLQGRTPAQLDSLRRAAQQGETSACLALVEHYQLVELQPDSAQKYLKIAAQKGAPEAQYLLGLTYLRGVEGPKRPAEGRRLLEAAAAQNYLLALKVLYEVLEPPDSLSPLYVAVLPPDAKAAFRYAQRAAELGDPQAMTTLGRYYASGKGGTPRNDSLAQFWLEKAAQTGYIPAQLLLAEWSLQRWHNPAKALFWAHEVLRNPRSTPEALAQARVAAYYAEYLPQWLHLWYKLLFLPAEFSALP
ncbi:MAG: sel1 repeat family protein [Bacteroidia bacterium]|nr:sel1 repeat family protein [Bacteroidia bacterium]MDW8089202.1 tetratricopeptide repeat protein [Bacteroidia bacterium]